MFIKTAISWEFVTIKFSTTIVQTTILRLNRKMGARNTESVKNIVLTQSYRWALNPKGFKRVFDDIPVDITQLSEDDKGLYYKDEPYSTAKLHQRLIVIYSPKYALYQKTLRNKQIERAQKMLDSGSTKRNRKIQLILPHLLSG